MAVESLSGAARVNNGLSPVNNWGNKVHKTQGNVFTVTDIICSVLMERSWQSF